LDSDSSGRARPVRRPGTRHGRNPHPAWNPPDPAGTMAWAVDVPRGESRTGHHPGRTRFSGRRTPGPDASLFYGSKARGTAARTPLPPLGRSGYATQALRRPGPRSASGTGRGEGPLVTLGPNSARPSQWARSLKQDPGGSLSATRAPGWKEVALVERGGKQVHTSGPDQGTPPDSRRHASRRAKPRGKRLACSGSPRDVGCMQPGRSRGNQLPGRWTGA